MAGVSSSKFEVMKFDGTGNFGLWQRRVKDLLVQQGMVKALADEKPTAMSNADWAEIEAKAVSTIRLCLGDDVMYDVMDEESPGALWQKLESRYMSKSLSNKLYLKQKLYGLKMEADSDLSQHINVFNRLISDLLRIDVKFDEEDKALILLNSLPSTDAYENLHTTLTWGKETLDFEDVVSALLGFYHRKKNGEESSKAGDALVIRSGRDRGRSMDKHDGRSRSKSRSYAACWRCGKKGHFKRECKEKEKRDGDLSSGEGNIVYDDVLCVSDGVSGGYIMDSGCCFHMTPVREHFMSYQDIDGGEVEVANGSKCAVVGIGTIRMKVHDGSVRTLTGVRHVPNLSRGLISLGALDDEGCRCSLGGGVLKVIRGSLVLMKAKKIGGIYHLLGKVVSGNFSRGSTGCGSGVISRGGALASNAGTRTRCTGLRVSSKVKPTGEIGGAYIDGKVNSEVERITVPGGEVWQWSTGVTSRDTKKVSVKSAERGIELEPQCTVVAREREYCDRVEGGVIATGGGNALRNIRRVKG